MVVFGVVEDSVRVFADIFILYLSYIYSIFILYLSYIYSMFIVCCSYGEVRDFCCLASGICKNTYF